MEGSVDDEVEVNVRFLKVKRMWHFSYALISCMPSQLRMESEPATATATAEEADDVLTTPGEKRFIIESKKALSL